MNAGRTIFSQLMEFVSPYEFQLCVDRYHGDRYVKDFSCWDQFLCMAFAQLTFRDSLRVFAKAGAFFITRSKKHAQYYRR